MKCAQITLYDAHKLVTRVEFSRGDFLAHTHLTSVYTCAVSLGVLVLYLRKGVNGQLHMEIYIFACHLYIYLFQIRLIGLFMPGLSAWPMECSGWSLHLMK